MSNEYQTGDTQCSLAKAVDLIGERWVFFIIREALAGVTRFADFRQRLGIASDILTRRLNMLVEHDILRRQEYQKTGERLRYEYVLTPAGDDLLLPLIAIQQWGQRHTPSTVQQSVVFQTGDGAAAYAVLAADDTSLEGVTARRLEQTAPR